MNSLCVKLPHEPPTLFKFAVGEHPCLPVFGRHFKNCSTKISYGQGRAEAVVKHIFRILKEYFPSNISLWSELNEGRMEELKEFGFHHSRKQHWSKGGYLKSPM